MDRVPGQQGGALGLQTGHDHLPGHSRVGPDEDSRAHAVLQQVTEKGGKWGDVEQAHRWQEQVFDQLTAGWSEQRRRDFQQAMTELMDQSYAMDAYC